MCPSTTSRVEIPPSVRTWLESALERETELPMLPEAAARVIALCDDEQSDARKLESVLERDPSLTASVLRVANSALYASSEPIVSLQHAVSRLGLACVRNIALSASLQGRVFDVPGRTHQIQAIWTHSAVSGVWAREIARKLRRNVEGAFLCGLVHDVGRPVVLQTLSRMPADRGSLSEDQVEHVMEAHHARLGARLVAAWGLAEWTSAAVAHHHDPDRATPHEEEARITRLADVLAHWAADSGNSPADFPVDDPVVVDLNLYPEDLDELLAMRERVLLAAEAFR